MEAKNTFPNVETITELFSSLEFLEPLNEKNIDMLLKLKLNSEQMFSLKYRDFLVEAVYLINSIGFDESYKFFKTQQKEKDRFNIIKNCPAFDESRRSFFLEITKDLRTEIAESYIPCIKCKKKTVVTESRQTRSADEGMTNFHKCMSCGAAWQK